MTAGFDRGIDSSPLCFAQERESEFTLQERFTAAERHSAARTSEKDPVGFHRRHNVADTSEGSEDMQSFAGALRDTGKTHVAELTVDFDLAIFRRSNSARRATLEAETTLADPNTLVRIQGQFRLNVL